MLGFAAGKYPILMDSLFLATSYPGGPVAVFAGFCSWGVVFITVAAVILAAFLRLIKSTKALARDIGQLTFYGGVFTAVSAVVGSFFVVIDREGGRFSDCLSVLVFAALVFFAGFGIRRWTAVSHPLN